MEFSFKFTNIEEALVRQQFTINEQQIHFFIKALIFREKYKLQKYKTYTKPVKYKNKIKTITMSAI